MKRIKGQKAKSKTIVCRCGHLHDASNCYALIDGLYPNGIKYDSFYKQDLPFFTIIHQSLDERWCYMNSQPGGYNCRSHFEPL